jgi:hypothetical protein
MTPCSLVDKYQRFEGSCYFHLDYRKYYLEDGGKKFLRNVGSPLQNKRDHIPKDRKVEQVLVLVENKGGKAEDEKTKSKNRPNFVLFVALFILRFVGAWPHIPRQ